MGKKKFIDKKKAATFALLYKESGEDDGGERVFTRVDNNVDVHPDFIEEESDFEKDEEPWSSKTDSSEQTRKELLEMGFPDDGYNYMKHMRTIGAPGHAFFIPTPQRVESLSLPVDVKVYDATKVRVEGTSSDAAAAEKTFTKVKEIQAPIAKVRRLDSEVTAFLDDSDISDNEGDLEDDFVAIANEGAEVESLARNTVPRVFESDRHDSEYEEDTQSVVSDHEETQPGADRQSVVSLAITAKDLNVQLLEEQFEVINLKDYDDDVFEDDDDPRARGHADISQFSDILDEFLAANPDLCGRNRAPAAEPEKARIQPQAPEEEQHVQQVDELVEQDAREESGPEEELEAVWVEDEDEKGVKWDCESILSSYSNLDNHPGRITVPTSTNRVKFGAVVEQSMEPKIRLAGKQRLPIDFIKRKDNDKEKVPNDPPAQRKKSVIGVESREERKVRKAVLKEERKATRKAKKEIKSQFKAVSQKAQAGAAVSMRTIHLS